MNDNKPTAEFPCYSECIRIPANDDQPAQLMTARFGNFCGKEFGRMKSALELAPEVIEHVLSLVESKGTTDTKVDGSREAPLPMNTQAFNDVHETYRRLVYWSRVWARAMGVQAPGPAVRAWRDMNGTVVGLPSNITPSAGRYIIGIMSTWLKVNLESILNLAPDDVLVFQDDLKDIFRINARWPRQARPEYSQMPCNLTGCKGKLAVYPPEQFGDDQLIKCEKCGNLLSSELYEFYWNLFKQVQAEADPVKRHLLRKYGAA